MVAMEEEEAEGWRVNWATAACRTGPPMTKSLWPLPPCLAFEDFPLHCPAKNATKYSTLFKASTTFSPCSFTFFFSSLGCFPSTLSSFLHFFSFQSAVPFCQCQLGLLWCCFFPPPPSLIEEDDSFLLLLRMALEGWSVEDGGW